MKEDFRQALIKTLPILCGYAFLGFAFGILLQKAGFNVFWALLISTVVYAGSLQFLLVSFMAAAAPLLNVFAASLFINSRHLFYGISFIDRFRKAKRYCPYLVFSLTDETYSVLCAEKDLDHISDRQLFLIHLLNHLYWITASAAGSIAGTLISFDLEGIDFAMTALFAVILCEQVHTLRCKLPIVIGACCAVFSFLIFDSDAFLLPALVSAVILLSVFRGRIMTEEDMI